jgi:hypothetical protein
MKILKFTLILIILISAIISNPIPLPNEDQPKPSHPNHINPETFKKLMQILESKSIVDLRKITFEIEKVFHNGDNKETRQFLLDLEKKYMIGYIQKKLGDKRAMKKLEEMMTMNGNDVKKAKPFTPLPIGGNIHDYIASMDINDLRETVLGIAAHHRIANNIPEDAEGELHDYVFKMGQHDLITNIIKEINEHPEINDLHAIEQLVLRYKVLHGGDARIYPLPDEKESEKEIDKEVEEHLKSIERKEIMDLALSCERYHKSVYNMTHVYGGLHDYIWNLSDDLIREYIKKEIREHPELNKLSSMKYVGEFNFGIDKIILTMNKTELINLSYKLEKYHKQAIGQSQEFLGGLHDNIWKWNEDEILTYIVKEIKEHKELNNEKQFLEMQQSDSGEANLKLLVDEGL